MHHGVAAHDVVAVWPVQLKLHRVTHCGQRGTFDRHVNRVPLFVIDCGCNRGAMAVEGQRALVAGLSAGQWVEHRLVQNDAAAFIDRNNLGRAVPPIGILTKEQGRHAGTSSNTFGTMDSSVNHAGTGRFFERRKSGLKSFEA